MISSPLPPQPGLLSSLFGPSLVNENEVNVRRISKRISKLRYDNYVKMYGPCHYTNLTNITKLQSFNTVWQLHREGRITASVAKQSFNVNHSLTL